MASQQHEPTGNKWFANFAGRTAAWVGSPYVFLFAFLTIVVWVVTGPVFHFSNTWQLVINSWANIVTFIMVFIIQNSQNRDSKAINLKLDELIRSLDKAHDEMIDIEKLSNKELGDLAQRYEAHQAGMGRTPHRPRPAAQNSVAGLRAMDAGLRPAYS